MWSFFRDNPRALLAAILVHLILLALMAFSFDWTPTVATKGETREPIKAVVVDADKLNEEVNRQIQIKQAQENKRQEALKQLEIKAQEAKKAREIEERRLAEVKQKAEAAKRKAELEAKQRAAAKLKAEQAAKQKAEAEKQRKLEEAKRLAQQKRLAEEKRQAEAERKAQEKRLVEEKRKAEAKRLAQEKKRQAAAKRKAEQDAKRKAAEAALQASLAQEQEALAMQRSNKEVNRYIAYIQDKVQRSWIRPPGSSSSMTCLVGVRLIPSGEVVDAKILRSSGNTAFDRSVESAVFKASPLPVPKDPKIMERFRSFNFEFKPG